MAKSGAATSSAPRCSECGKLLPNRCEHCGRAWPSHQVTCPGECAQARRRRLHAERMRAYRAAARGEERG